MATCEGTSAAKRRRVRRQRSRWRREQLSVAMALAAATHYSAGGDRAAGGGSHNQLRGCRWISSLVPVAGGRCDPLFPLQCGRALSGCAGQEGGGRRRRR